MTTIDLIDAGEIARMLGVSRAHCVGRLIKRPDFPRPAVNISQKLRRWQRDAVLRWMVKSTPPRPQPSPGSTSAATAADRGARKSAQGASHPSCATAA